MPGVGANLHDHFNTYVAWRCTQPVTINDLAHAARCASCWRRAVCVHAAPGRSVERRHLRRRAGAQRPAPRTARPADQHVRRGAPWSALRTGIKPHPFSAFTISPVHLRPDGRGTVQLKSPDPLGAAGDPVQVSRQRLRFPGADLRHAAGAQDRRAAGAASPIVVEEVLPGAAVPDRRGADRGDPRSAASPTCTRSAPAAWGARSTRWSIRGSGCTASRGCASPTPRSCRRCRRQHQRALDHDRREMRRDDPGGRAGGVRNRA